MQNKSHPDHLVAERGCKDETFTPIGKEKGA